MTIEEVMRIVFNYGQGREYIDFVQDAIEAYGRDLQDDGYEDGFEVAADAGVMGS